LDPALPLGLLPYVRGFVVEGYGAGNFPVSRKLQRPLLPFFRAAHDAGKPVVVVSQARHNGVDLSLYESGAAAAEAGAISGGDMTPSAALVKLMHALAYERDLRSVREYLLRAVAGERT